MPRPRLVKIQKSRRAGKKLDAVFEWPDGRRRSVPFGATGYSDYTMHHDKERRRRYIERHARREDWTDPTKPGTLSRYILWGPTTDRRSAVRSYKRRFGV